jgi:hypothetical protein
MVDMDIVARTMLNDSLLFPKTLMMVSAPQIPVAPELTVSGTAVVGCALLLMVVVALP